MSKSVQRAIKLIELISEEPRSLADLAASFDVDRSTVFRTLQTLIEAGLVLPRVDRRYSIGPRLISIAETELSNFDLRRVAQDQIRAFRRPAGSTVHLAQLLDDNSIVYIDKAEPRDGVRLYSRIGRTALPHASGVGKVILAQVSSARRDAILKDVQWKAHTENTHTNRASLEQDLKEIQTRGWGVDNGEFEDFVTCIAVPVTNVSGSILGAISVTTLTAIADLDELSHYLDEMLAAAKNISDSLI